jgi:hypothetical protein
MEGEREREHMRGCGLSPTGGVHLSGNVSARGLAVLSWPEWAEIGFSFSLKFLMSFLFIFSIDFKSNLNQNSNSNQFKHVHQTKE